MARNRSHSPPPIPPVNRIAELHATSDLVINRFDHPPHEHHCDPDEEIAGRWSIAFVDRGSFDVLVHGAHHHLVAGSVFITQPGLRFCCSHTDSCPDDVCLSVSFAPSAVRDSAHDAEHAWAKAGWAARAHATPKLALVHKRLHDATSVGDTFQMERWALAALTALGRDSTDARARGHYAARMADLETVMAAMELIDSDPARTRSVADLAHAVGSTSTRLTHMFRRYCGASPHQYVVRARLLFATSLLNNGHSVTDTCFRAGFENLSHFCRSFARATGVRASAWRQQTVRERRRRTYVLANNLIAGRAHQQSNIVTRSGA